MRVCLLIVALVAVGCGSSTSSSDLSMPADLAMSSSGADMFSVCGHPGDTGNSKGVGKYCTDTSAGSCPAGTICSTLMQPPQGTTYFCTLPCNINDTTNVCGENATCTCLSGNTCGCVPDTCRITIFG